MSVKPGAKNQPDDIKIRKYRDTLVTGGFAIIAFGIWTVIRGVLEVGRELANYLNTMSFEGFTEEEAEQLREMIADKTLFYGALVIIIVLMAVELAIRIYVGYSARAVGLQKKKRNGQERSGIIWLIFGVILAILGGFSFVYMLVSAKEILAEHSVMYYLVQLLMEGTSLFVTAEMVVKGFLLRGLTRKHKETEEVRDAA